MEALARMVDDSLARHGLTVSVDHRRLQWSRWFRCESSFSLLLVPSAAGVYALSEEILAPNQISAAGGKRMLAVFQVGETEDLCWTLSRHFAPKSPLSERLASGRCFVRFAQVADPDQRRAACESLNRWLASSTEAATGLVKDFSAVEFTSSPDVEQPSRSTESPEKTSEPAPKSEPPPFPAGF
jgi:hypothetical protein